MTLWLRDFLQLPKFSTDQKIAFVKEVYENRESWTHPWMSPTTVRGSCKKSKLPSFSKGKIEKKLYAIEAVLKILLASFMSLISSNLAILPSFCKWFLMSFQSGFPMKFYELKGIQKKEPFSFSGQIRDLSNGLWGGAFKFLTTLSFNGSARSSIKIFQITLKFWNK